MSKHTFTTALGAVHPWSDISYLIKPKLGDRRIDAMGKNDKIIILDNRSVLESSNDDEMQSFFQIYQEQFESYKAMEMENLHAAIAREKAKDWKSDEIHAEEFLETLGSVGC